MNRLLEKKEMENISKLRNLLLVMLLVFVVLSITGCRDKEALKQFWSVGTGTQSQTPFYTALGISFLICEIINVRTRLAMRDKQIFDVTVWLSYPVCMGSPLVGMFVSRYLLSWLNMASPIYFTLLSTVISIPLCILGTRWIISYGRIHIEELSKIP
jgi:hypothetical protein